MNKFSKISVNILF